jgi:uncharacterized membrane protein YfcA
METLLRHSPRSFPILPAARLPDRSRRPVLKVAGVLAFAAYATWLSAAAPMEHPVWTALAILAASSVSSVAGFAFPAICGAILFHLSDDPVRVVQIMMLCGAAGQSLMVWALRRNIPWRTLAVFLAGAAFGLPLGVMVLLHTRHAVYAQVIGIALVLYALLMLPRRPLVVRRHSALLDALFGFLSGVTGGAAALPGMFVTLWCGFKGWPKEQQRALYQPFILIMQLSAIALMTVPGVAPQGRPAFDFGGIAYVPVMFLGTTLGLAFFRQLNDRQFALVVNLLMAVSGLALLV